MVAMFLGVIALLAFLIIVGTIIAVIVILRRPESAQSSGQSSPDVVPGLDTSTPDALPGVQPTPSPTPQEDMQDFMTTQKQRLAEFELKDLSNSFQGTTGDGERQGAILHLTEEALPLIVFSSRAPSAKNGVITAETIYGEMKVAIGQGRAGIQWNGEPIGILEFSNQRILGPEGQLLGRMERPLPDSVGIGEVSAYPISFMGEKAADVGMLVNALSTLRWFGDEDADQQAAFENVASDLEDNQTLILLGALLLEFGFFSIL